VNEIAEITIEQAWQQAAKKQRDAHVACTARGVCFCDWYPDNYAGVPDWFRNRYEAEQ
jgi:hypothetical protein